MTIGSPGNPANTFPPGEGPQNIGSVPYEYGLAKYEISEQMIDKANALSLTAGAPLGITKDTRGPDKPATSVTWFEAARFVNWLNTSSGAPAAYKFDSAGAFQLWAPTDPGYNPANLFRNSRARYVLPSADEWHKAAYYDPNLQVYYLYPTGSNSVPDGIDFVGDPNFDAVFDDGANQLEPNMVTNVGAMSPYGVFGLGGNVLEWNETAFDRLNTISSEQRRAFGGLWASDSELLNATNTLSGVAPTVSGSFIGFRVSRVVPEPTSSAICFLFIAFAWGMLSQSPEEQRITLSKWQQPSNCSHP